MNEKKSLFITDILMNIIGVYFSTFFVFYFFRVSNYEILPLVKYYLFDYIITGISYILIRNSMKKNIRVPYFQIGISLQAIYIAIIMLLKENIVHFIFVLGFVKGLANAFYYFPRSILESDKIDNKERQLYEGRVSTINQITAIIIPIILGFLLTHFSYTDLGKVFFLLFVVMFVCAFKLKDTKPNNNKFDFKGFKNILKTNENIKLAVLIPLSSGLSYASGVMTLIVTLLKIGIFKTNFNLGLVDGVCGFLCLLVCIFYARIIKEKHFNKILLIAGIMSFISLMALALFDSEVLFIIYLFIRFTCITIISLISETIANNLTNTREVKKEFKAEYYCFREIMYSTSRSVGYLILLVVSLTVGNEYISYILILSGASLLLESGILYSLAKKQVKS